MRRSHEAVELPSPEDHLQRAIAARTPTTRAKYAKLGLSAARPIDRTTQAMLLRQLYLSHFEAGRFEKAVTISLQVVELGVLPDVAHQDAARALQPLGRVDEAIGHLRLAARTSPASRRAFHLWTLGGLLYLERRYVEAASALRRATRWGTTDKPLYAGHAALARAALGDIPTDLDQIVEQLAAAPCGQGYGRFVLGRLSCYAKRYSDAHRYLQAFIQRTAGGRKAVAIALEGELTEARRSLAELLDN